MNDRYWQEDEYESYSINNMVTITYADYGEKIGDIGVIVGKVAPEGIAQSFTEYYVLTSNGIQKKASDCITDLGHKCTLIYKYLYV